MTVSRDRLEQALLAAKDAVDHPVKGGARIVGVNMEGPFLSKERKGAQKEEDILPPCLLYTSLDEATSALDNESEKIVQASCEKLAKGRTTFTIAHRLTTIKNASVILVLTHNGIEEKGTHQELMEKRGIYYHLYGWLAENPPRNRCRSAPGPGP